MPYYKDYIELKMWIRKNPNESLFYKTVYAIYVLYSM